MKYTRIHLNSAYVDVVDPPEALVDDILFLSSPKLLHLTGTSGRPTIVVIKHITFMEEFGDYFTEEEERAADAAISYIKSEYYDV